MPAAATKAKAKTKGCDCFNKVNEALKPYNTCLKKTITMTQGATLSMGLAMTIATEKIDSTKRKPAKSVMPTYCPFCGVKL
jgi:hypothetical protein